ncbi:MAG: hypothetical protein ACTSRH_10120 [Promethearchaeota archaeon]
MNNNKIGEFYISSKDLITLFNVLYKFENYTFNVFPYILNRNLFKFQLDKSITLQLLIEKREYNEISNIFYNFFDIFPRFEFVRNILLASGFLHVGNQEELWNQIERIKRIDPLKGERITYIGMDTNCYINRLFSLISRRLGRDSKKLCYVTSRIIQNELTSMEKIKQQKIDQLKNILDFSSNFLEDFWNSETVKARNKRLGLGEFRKMRNVSHCLINTSVKKMPNQENDFQIIEDFRNQVISRNHDLLVLTFDKQFYDMAREEGSICVLLSFPPLDDIPNKLLGDWEDLCDLIYLSSIFFGKISLRSKSTVQISGIWRGKKPEDWDKEIIKVKIGSNLLATTLNKQLDIIHN